MSRNRLDWARDGSDWPNREASRFVRAAGLSWHVQRMGAGPQILLLHGTGASTHSYRRLARLLEERCDVFAPDLPGHGFSDPLPYRRLSLPGMSDAVGSLCAKLGVAPEIVVGHSAGAAVAIRMTLDGLISPRAIVSVNGALLPIWTGFSAPFFASAAKLLAANPIAPWLFARRARDPATVDRLLRGTGSKIADEDARFYRRLAGTTSHVAGALGMMAGWDLKAFGCDLGRLETPLILVAGTRDGMVPASSAEAVRRLAPRTRIVRLEGLGHLAHEEAPELVRDVIEGALSDQAPAGPKDPFEVAVGERMGEPAHV
ncbi:alpha/beta fold hydrolase BchO [Methylopila turkensis]|uniref:Alpha/beta hydrolase n=1 Tax=Methylopila turkensis TaxID=1437816 RepID=A0A9W6JJQ1_9HYPH|nr:alpha/beta fold hydrolase BchO [Methylopila turkensis]GLK78277.1 alpha/beta hydrolase [Methylopila turkensis]